MNRKRFEDFMAKTASPSILYYLEKTSKDEELRKLANGILGAMSALKGNLKTVGRVAGKALHPVSIETAAGGYKTTTDNITGATNNSLFQNTSGPPKTRESGGD